MPAQDIPNKFMIDSWNHLNLNLSRPSLTLQALYHIDCHAQLLPRPVQQREQIYICTCRLVLCNSESCIPYYQFLKGKRMAPLPSAQLHSHHPCKPEFTAVWFPINMCHSTGKLWNCYGMVNMGFIVCQLWPKLVCMNSWVQIWSCFFGSQPLLKFWLWLFTCNSTYCLQIILHTQSSRNQTAFQPMFCARWWVPIRIKASCPLTWTNGC